MPELKNRVMEKISDMSEKELIILLDALDRPDRLTEKRRYSRIPYSTSAEYASRTVKGWGELKDISVGGLFMVLDPARNPLFLGQEIALRVPHPKKGKKIKLRGEIVRATPEGVGVEFTAPEAFENSGHP